MANGIVMLPRMSFSSKAQSLLDRAAQLHDAPNSCLKTSVRQARSCFHSGGEWMRMALTVVRNQALTPAPLPKNIQLYGFIKYGLASTAALVWLVAALWVHALLIPLAVLAFYSVEAQMVFLFPLALDGSTRPFRDAWVWTRRAGGTLAVMGVVLPLASVMVFGGFLGRGFVRCWCLGCLAVCLWYVELVKDWCKEGNGTPKLISPLPKVQPG